MHATCLLSTDGSVHIYDTLYACSRAVLKPTDPARRRTAATQARTKGEGTLARLLEGPNGGLYTPVASTAATVRLASPKAGRSELGAERAQERLTQGQAGSKATT